MANRGKDRENMIQFIAGLFAGAVITAAIFILFRNVEEDDKRKDHCELCHDCVHRHKHAWDEPCDTCHGDKYEYEHL